MPKPGSWALGAADTGLWQQGRAASRAGVVSQLEGSPCACSPLALMVWDAADSEGEGWKQAWLRLE